MFSRKQPPPYDENTVQVGADFLTGYQMTWRAIRQRGTELGAAAKAEETSFFRTVDRWYQLHNEWLELHKHLKLLPAIQQRLAQTQQSVADVCKKVERLEIALDQVLERQNWIAHQCALKAHEKSLAQMSAAHAHDTQRLREFKRQQAQKKQRGPQADHKGHVASNQKAISTPSHDTHDEDELQHFEAVVGHETEGEGTSEEEEDEEEVGQDDSEQANVVAATTSAGPAGQAGTMADSAVRGDAQHKQAEAEEEDDDEGDELEESEVEDLP
eukprot:g26198.t1